MKIFVKTHKLPHLLFYGPAGTGKTSTVKALANAFFNSAGKKESFFGSNYVLELNASDDRGIDTIRDKIKTFASTLAFQQDANSTTGCDFKIIILDEVDAMTSTAQNALRRSKTITFLMLSHGKIHQKCPLHPHLQLRWFNYSSLAVEVYEVSFRACF